MHQDPVTVGPFSDSGPRAAKPEEEVGSRLKVVHKCLRVLDPLRLAVGTIRFLSLEIIDVKQHFRRGHKRHLRGKNKENTSQHLLEGLLPERRQDKKEPFGDKGDRGH